MAEPFQPRFVDLVRNYTTTQGTGNLVLGQAVNGFTGFAAAVEPDDQFYYSVIGVDKPQEREVGRGTMQSNGSIARQPIGGGLTNFSSGTKTVALIAAAEWFEKIEAVGEASGSAATRSVLAGLPPGVALLAEPGREGLFVFDNANLSAKVSADSRQGIYVAPASDPSGASGAWVRNFSGRADARWWGAIADDNGSSGTDNLAAINGALATLAARSNSDMATRRFSEELFFDGFFYIGGTINLKQAIRLTGLSSGQSKYTRSRLRFPANSDGIIVNMANTTGVTVESPPSTSAEGTIIDGLALHGGGGSSGHGIRLRARATVRNCYIENFGGDGIHIDSGSSAGGASEGNANNFYLDSVVCFANGRDGVRVTAAGNGNAGTGVHVQCAFNAASGINDSSFLGNYWFGCFTEVNGNKNWVPGATKAGACVNYLGASYACRLGQDAAAATTTPGSNAEVWIPTGAAIAFAPNWTNGIQVQSGGPYACDSANSRAAFYGCYAEGGQAPVQMYGHNIFEGFAIETTGFFGSGGRYNGNAGRLTLTNGLETVRGDWVAASGRMTFTGSASAAAASGGAFVYRNASDGLTLMGEGSACDIVIANKAGAAALAVPTGTRDAHFFGDVHIDGSLTGITIELGNGDHGDVVVSGGGATMIVESASPADGTFDIAGGIKLTANLASFAGAGSIYTNPVDGLAIVAKTGSSNDVGFYTPTGGAVFVVPTGTPDVNYYGDLLLNSGKALKVNGVAVVSGRKTGWSAATGTASRAAFDTASVTTAQLAQRVKGLIDDLIGHGLIGA